MLFFLIIFQQPLNNFSRVFEAIFSQMVKFFQQILLVLASERLVNAILPCSNHLFPPNMIQTTKTMIPVNVRNLQSPEILDIQIQMEIMAAILDRLLIVVKIKIPVYSHFTITTLIAAVQTDQQRRLVLATKTEKNVVKHLYKIFVQKRISFSQPKCLSVVNRVFIQLSFWLLVMLIRLGS